MKHIWLMLILAFCVSGCGNKVSNSSSEKAVSSANALLDNGKFEEAISVLEPLHEQDKSNQEVNSKLLHAYAGAGSFKAVEVMSIWKEIEKSLDDMKKKTEKKAVDSILADVEKMLEPIPVITEQQKQRLDQAISLYQELGLDVDTAGKYNNFKWGVLHTYRLAITLKEIVVVAKASQEGDKVNLKALEKVVIPRLKIMGQDLFMAYKLYGNSFDKIKKITDSVDKLIARTIKNDDFKLKISTIAKNESEFFKALVNDNIHLAGVVVSKLSDIYHNNGHKDKVKAALAKLPTEEELKESQKRIETLIKVFIAQFNEDHPEVENKLKSIFTDQLKAEVIETIKICIREKNTNALKELLESKRPEVEVLKGYYLILKGDFEASDLEEELKAEIETIKKKVDLELLKTELEEVLVALKDDTKVLQGAVAIQMHLNSQKLAERKVIIEKEINAIKADLEDVTSELKESINAENDDTLDVETQNNIIMQTAIELAEEE